MRRRKDSCNQSDVVVNGSTASALFFLHFGISCMWKRGIWWLWWLIWLIQSISDAVCHQWTVQITEDNRFMREIGTLLWKKSCKLISFKKIYIYIVFMWELLVISMTSQVIPSKKQVAKTNAKEKSHFLTYRSLIYFKLCLSQCCIDFT